MTFAEVDRLRAAEVGALSPQNLAPLLAGAWRRYTNFFGEPPHGTEQQMLALCELLPSEIERRKEAQP